VSAPKPAKLLWIDLEMTGLDPDKDRILEVAAIATDWNFTEIASYEAVKKVGPTLMRKRMVGEFWDKYTEVRQALVAQNTHGKHGRTVENELLALIEAHFDADEPVLLAGNSVHQDRRFLVLLYIHTRRCHRRAPAAFHKIYQVPTIKPPAFA
jgi:oligoribonuclease